MNHLLLAQEMQELTLAPWLGPLFLAIILLCVTAWYAVINRRLAGEEAVPYEARKPVPWGADGAALAIMAVSAAVITFFSTTFSPDMTEGELPTNAPITFPGEGSVAPQAVTSFLGDLESEELNSNDSKLRSVEASPKLDLSIAGQYAAISALLVVLMIGWQRMQVCASWTDFGLPSSFRQLINDIAIGILTFAAALLPVYAVQVLLVSILGVPSSHQVLEDLINDPSGTMLLVAGLMAVVVAPLFEEFSFRVMLQGWLEKLADQKPVNENNEETLQDNTRKFWPILVSSFAFAIAHTGQGYAPVALFVLACFLGYVYRQTHRLAPCVVAHMAFNALSLAMAFGSAPGLHVE